MLIRRTQLDKGTDQQTIYMCLALFVPVSPYFSHLFLPKSPTSLIFPTFGSSLKYP